MANNRLFIVDSETGDRFMLAKSFGAGWELRDEETLAQRLTEWLNLRDVGASYGSMFTTLALCDENHLFDGWKSMDAAPHDRRVRGLVLGVPRPRVVHMVWDAEACAWRSSDGRHLDAREILGWW